MKVLLVLLMIVAVCVTTSVALQCYNCISPADANCGDADSSIAKKMCDEPGSVEKMAGVTNVCMKMVLEGNAIKCYDCRSPKDPFCNDPQSEIRIKDCDEYSGAENLLGVKSVCMKIVYDVRGFEQVTRQCGVIGNILKPCESMRSAESCHTCEYSLCNGSTNLLANLWLSLLPFVIAMIIKF
ncbi:unnamed protein product [Diamesa tonsa]